MSQFDQAGIDVSAEWFDVVMEREGARKSGRFPNTPAGFKQLIRWLRQRGRVTRVAMDSTGTYGMDLAVALADAPAVQLMVVPSRQARRFAESLGRRNKTDQSDAAVMLEYVQRMDFVEWTKPAPQLLQARSFARTIRQLLDARTVAKNQLHANRATKATPPMILDAHRRMIGHFTTEIEKLEKGALALIQRDPELRRRFDLAISVKGIAKRSAIQLLGELAYLPAGMSAAQWVAHAGLYPRLFQSGSSIKRQTTIGKAGNKHLRAALFMPAICAGRCDDNVRAFKDRLVDRGLVPLQATIAIMRKLLHALHAIWERNEAYRSELCFPPLPVKPSSQKEGRVA